MTADDWITPWGDLKDPDDYEYQQDTQKEENAA
ncbi:hypothetical protein SAMN05216268_12683 [Streptomyces yunnanensis]|uniref:Uncharacterized protein n=1 Tax=Streptomyces yunnanensis TaxID=156453 RepID=A0A9X8QZK2_9ACTN|nr:hypothetical protein SAMN05216268_12683 [Streptomyces yunnanensis]